MFLVGSLQRLWWEVSGVYGGRLAVFMVGI